MYASPSYPEPDEESVETFVQSQPYAVVMASPPSGHPTASLLPFVKAGARITVHMVQEDATCRALADSGRGSVLVEEFLAFTPHTLISPDYAGQATLHFRAVLYEVEARVSTDRRRLVEALEELLARYEPDLPHRPLADEAVYGSDLARLAVADLRVVSRQAKFKVAQNRDAATRARIAAWLRARGAWRDGHAADVLTGR